MKARIHQQFSKLIFCLFLSAAPSSLRAELTYKVNGTSITITGSNPQAIGGLVIPASVQGLPVISIGSEAFDSCSGLTSVTIPDSVTSIDYRAFWKCGALTNVTFGNGVTSIGFDSFGDCVGLTSLIIPDSVTSIGYFAFLGCKGLTNIYIPNSVTNLEPGAFCGTGLQSVTIPDSITSIAGVTFSRCPELTNFVVGANNLGLSSRDGVLFDKTQTSLINFPNGRIGSFTIPSTVTYLDWYAFVGSPWVTRITVPDGVDSIYGCFTDCPSLTSVYFMGDEPITNEFMEDFEGSPNVTVYYRPSKARWSTSFAGRPTAIFDPKLTLQSPVKNARNQILLTLQNGGDLEFLVEYTDDFRQWIPLETKLVGAKDLSELDPEAPNRPFRFYRIRH